MVVKKLPFVVLFACLVHNACSGKPCFEHWLSGKRLRQIDRQLSPVDLATCQEQCAKQSNCAAIAFGNRTCELALGGRGARSVNGTISELLVDSQPIYDVYKYTCGGKNFGATIREYLYDRGGGGGYNRNQPQSGVPIDCFYRLVSGRRLAKPHALKSISVKSLQECQEACIRESSFACRSVSYRYMPSGYSYSVSNCELSPYYMRSSKKDQQQINYDFVDDFDYDYFQREPYCKTSGGGLDSLGVCSVVVRRSGRLSPSLTKTTSSVSSVGQCEHLCTTTTRLRCRAFSFRHTDRGGAGRYTQPADNCHLYDSDLSRLPSYNVENDPDFDLFEMGRLMGGSCVLYNQQQYRPERYPPVTDRYDFNSMPQDREIMGGAGGHRQIGNGYDPEGRQPITHYKPYYDEQQPSPMSPVGPSRPPMDDNAGGGYFGQRFDPNTPRPPLIMPPHDGANFPSPPSTTTTPAPPAQLSSVGRDPGGRPGGVGGGGGNQASSSAFERDRLREIQGCLTMARTDAYLTPEVSRATFPVKTLEECRVECARSDQVLRFPCFAMAFRLVTYDSGQCQLSDRRDLDMRRDVMTSRNQQSSRYTSNGGVYIWDEAVPGCRKQIQSQNYNQQYQGNYNNRDNYNNGYYGNGRNNYYGNRVDYYDKYGRYGDRNYDNRRYYDTAAAQHQGGGYNYDRNRYYNDYNNQNRRYYDNRNNNNNYYNDNSRNRGGYYDNRYADNNYGRWTVDGERCLHSCVRNRDAGFFYCQTHQDGSWNFCCRPDDQGGVCGYSKGLSFSWCYVGSGPSRDIWRTCKRTPTVGYLHEGQPPVVSVVANATNLHGNVSQVAEEILRGEVDEVEVTTLVEEDSPSSKANSSSS